MLFHKTWNCTDINIPHLSNVRRAAAGKCLKSLFKSLLFPFVELASGYQSYLSAVLDFGRQCVLYRPYFIIYSVLTDLCSRIPLTNFLSLVVSHSPYMDCWLKWLLQWHTPCSWIVFSPHFQDDFKLITRASAQKFLILRYIYSRGINVVYFMGRCTDSQWPSNYVMVHRWKSWGFCIASTDCSFLTALICQPEQN